MKLEVRLVVIRSCLEFFIAELADVDGCVWIVLTARSCQYTRLWELWKFVIHQLTRANGASHALLSRISLDSRPPDKGMRLSQQQ